MIFKRLVALICLLLFATVIFADVPDLYSFKNENQEKRYRRLTQQIRCIVCQGQSVAESNAMLAVDLRNRIYEMIQNDHSDQAIEDFLTKRYGDSILLNPRVNEVTFLLWILPILLLSVALISVLSFCYRSKRPI